jgi:P27 family predicted phage terminase small subunit
VAAGKPGPAARPVELTRRLGNPGHRTGLPEQSAPIGNEVAETVEAPADLPPPGQDLWREVIPTLSKYGGLRSADLPALKAMCVAYARMVLAGQVLNAEGYFTLGSTGQQVAHPAFKMEQEASATFLRYAQQFGLTWLARSNLGLSEATRQQVLAQMGQTVGKNPRADVEQ